MRARLTDIGLTLLRVFAGVLMLTHGVEKLVNFKELLGGFPDPIGLGSETSLMLVVLAEAGCSLLLIMGALTRFAAAPLMVAMGVAVFHHLSKGDGLSAIELPLLYAAAFACILLSGPGSPSIDRWAAQGFSNRRRKPEPQRQPLPAPARPLEPRVSQPEIEISASPARATKRDVPPSAD